MPIWDDLLTGQDREVYEKAGYGRKVVFGKKPALLIIDVTYLFVGDKPEPILQSMKRYPQSSGEAGWKAVHAIASLLPLARKKCARVIYSAVAPFDTSLPYTWRARNPTAAGEKLIERGYDIVDEVAPQGNDIVISKMAPSIFFGTNLMSYLTPLGVDTLLVCGGTTSGCVRATVIDAASYSFKVGVIEEGCFDRVQISHKVNLCEMDAKYASVISVAEAREYLSRL